MTRGSAGAWLGGVAAATLAGCDGFDFGELTQFSYAPRKLPRVFVQHEPLLPAAGEDVTFRVVIERESADTVTSAVVTLTDAAGEAIAVQECAPADGDQFLCVAAMPAAEATLRYRARAQLASGSVGSRATYEFHVGAPQGDAIVPVRVPVKPDAELGDAYRVDLVWVRDPSLDALDVDQFRSDMQSATYAGILADPAYRWRDDQLGFHYYSQPAFTRSFYEGRDTRCGQNPWPAQQALPLAVRDAEVIGVIHRRGAAPGVVEGELGADTDVTAFRDCAGRAVRDAEVTTFSARGGMALVAKHELGHAAFGLGDEYDEPTETRSVLPDPPPLLGDECCCVVSNEAGGGNGRDDDGTVVVDFGEDEQRMCVEPGGGIQVASGLVDTPGDLPDCGANNSGLAPQCGESAAGGCPSIEAHCVDAGMWLGAAPPGGALDARGNVFATERECIGALALASVHPSIERRETAFGLCRLLCADDADPCPCTGGERWIVDTEPSAPKASVRPDDVMASVSTKRALHGGTCQWCVETSLCVRWQRARGESPEAAWDYCREPPEHAPEVENIVTAIVRWVIDGLSVIFRDART